MKIMAKLSSVIVHEFMQICTVREDKEFGNFHVQNFKNIYCNPDPN